MKLQTYDLANLAKERGRNVYRTKIEIESETRACLFLRVTASSDFLDRLRLPFYRCKAILGQEKCFSRAILALFLEKASCRYVDYNVRYAT